MRSYQEIQELFRKDWDAAILDIVAETPCRYTELARRLRGDVDVGLADGTLGRSLARLRAHKLIRTVEGPGRHGTGGLYEVTDLGRHKLGIYRAILEAYQRSRTGPEK